MGKRAVTAVSLVAAVVLSACFALGFFDGEGVSEVRDKDYTGFTYTGGLRNGRFTGYGSMVFQDGERYSGNFAAGRFDGTGRLACLTGDWNFNGVFQEGRVNSGTFYDHAGESVAYERGETADTLTGYTWSYEGGLSDRGQNGTGTFIFPDGSAYTGGFLRGLAEGEGIYSDASGGTVYTGGFKEGKFDGWGKYFSLEGWVYEGGFKDGLFDGEGAMTADTETVRGVWEKGVQVTRYEQD